MPLGSDDEVGLADTSLALVRHGTDQYQTGRWHLTCRRSFSICCDDRSNIFPSFMHGPCRLTSSLRAASLVCTPASSLRHSFFLQFFAQYARTPSSKSPPPNCSFELPSLPRVHPLDRTYVPPILTNSLLRMFNLNTILGRYLLSCVGDESM